MFFPLPISASMLGSNLLGEVTSRTDGEQHSQRTHPTANNIRCSCQHIHAICLSFTGVDRRLFCDELGHEPVRKKYRRGRRKITSASRSCASKPKETKRRSPGSYRQVCGNNEWLSIHGFASRGRDMISLSTTNDAVRRNQESLQDTGIINHQGRECHCHCHNRHAAKAHTLSLSFRRLVCLPTCRELDSNNLSRS